MQKDKEKAEQYEIVQVKREERTVSHRARLEVEKFNGNNNFGLWRTDVSDALEHLEACLRTDKPEEWSDNKWEKNKRLCLAAIKGCLETQVRVNYQHETSLKELWENLEAKYLVKNVANRIHLKRNLYRFNMKKGATFSEHLDSFNKLLTELVNYDEIIPDEEKALCLVNSLPEKYEPVIKSLIHGKDELKYVEVTITLRSEEFRKMDRDDISKEDSGDALSVRDRKFDRKKNVGQNRDKSIQRIAP